MLGCQGGSDEEDPSYKENNRASSEGPRRKLGPSVAAPLSQQELSAAASNLDKLKRKYVVEGTYSIHLKQFNGDNVPGHRPINADGVKELAARIRTEGLNSRANPVILLLLDPDADSHFMSESAPRWSQLSTGMNHLGQPCSQAEIDAGAPVDDGSKVRDAAEPGVLGYQLHALTSIVFQGGLGAGQHRLEALDQVRDFLAETTGKVDADVRWHCTVYRSGETAQSFSAQTETYDLGSCQAQDTNQS